MKPSAGEAVHPYDHQMKRGLIVFLSALVLAACGGSGGSNSAAPEETAAEASETATAGGPGIYEFNTETGTKIRIDLTGGEVTNEIATRAEPLRKEVGAGDVQWVPVDVDNTDGTEQTDIGTSVSVVNANGETFDLVPAFFPIGDWQGELDDPDLATDLYNAALKVAGDALPGAKSSAILVSEQPIGKPARVFVNGEEATLQQ